MSGNSPGRARRFPHFAFSGLILLSLSVTPCQAQQNSSAHGVTLSAVLLQSLTVSVTRDTVDVLQNSFDDSRGSKSSLTIAARWVRGQANVEVGVFAPGNPVLGARGQALVPVEIGGSPYNSRRHFADNFFSSQKLDRGSFHFQFSTSDLQVPEGGEPTTLTIRAEAL